MSIKMPTDEEKRCSIDVIISRSVRKKTTVAGLVRSVGVNNIFYGMGAGVLVAVMFSLMIAGVFAFAPYDPRVTYMAVFSVSPVMYAGLHLISLWKDVEEGTQELKNTCYHTPLQLTALRTLVFSGMSVVLNVAVAFFAGSDGGDALTLTGLSLSALFLYSGATLFSLLRNQVFLKQFIVPAGWLVLNMILFSADVSEQLTDLPAAVVIAISILTIAFYTIQFRRSLRASRPWGVAPNPTIF